MNESEDTCSALRYALLCVVRALVADACGPLCVALEVACHSKMYLRRTGLRPFVSLPRTWWTQEEGKVK